MSTIFEDTKSKVGDVVAWANVPDGALVRCAGVYVFFYLRAGGSGWCVGADDRKGFARFEMMPPGGWKVHWDIRDLSLATVVALSPDDILAGPGALRRARRRAINEALRNRGERWTAVVTRAGDVAYSVRAAVRAVVNGRVTKVNVDVLRYDRGRGGALLSVLRDRTVVTVKGGR